tara:strand:- start:976 stop:1101 length:126 start_codon:yes stop_codon:yes gene_type:complete
MVKVSECCGARLMKYDKNWDDGVCSECNEHSPAHKEEELTE